MSEDDANISKRLLSLIGSNLVQTLWPGGDKALEMLCGKAAVVSFYYVYMMYIIRPGIYVTFHHFPSFFFFLTESH